MYGPAVLERMADYDGRLGGILNPVKHSIAAAGSPSVTASPARPAPHRGSTVAAPVPAAAAAAHALPPSHLSPAPAMLTVPVAVPTVAVPAAAGVTVDVAVPTDAAASGAAVAIAGAAVAATPRTPSGDAPGGRDRGHGRRAAAPRAADASTYFPAQMLSPLAGELVAEYLACCFSFSIPCFSDTSPLRCPVVLSLHSAGSSPSLFFLADPNHSLFELPHLDAIKQHICDSFRPAEAAVVVASKIVEILHQIRLADRLPAREMHAANCIALFKEVLHCHAWEPAGESHRRVGVASPHELLQLRARAQSRPRNTILQTAAWFCAGELLDLMRSYITRDDLLNQNNLGETFSVLLEKGHQHYKSRAATNGGRFRDEKLERLERAYKQCRAVAAAVVGGAGAAGAGSTTGAWSFTGGDHDELESVIDDGGGVLGAKQVRSSQRAPHPMPRFARAHTC